MIALLFPVGFIAAAGLTVLSSISRDLFFLQLLWIGLGTALIVIFLAVDWRTIFSYQWFGWALYIAVVALLLVAFFTAPVIRNTRSWIVFGSFQIQPVELAKVALILIFAQYFSRRHLSVARWRHIFTSFALFAVPAALTLLQPDLGSTIVLFGIWFGFLLVSGLPRRRLAIAAVVFAAVGVLGWYFFLADYQKARIFGVFFPEENALTVNYSVIQSKIAIGSAGFFGRGYGQGPQTQLGFLTEPATDFIFAALIEEWGLIAGLLVILAFVFFILRILRIGLRSGKNYDMFICLGAAMVYSIHFLVNVGSATGLFPVVGLPFPFLSYGGSALLTNFFLLAIIGAIARGS